MKILSLGGLGWVVETEHTCIAINPNFTSFFGSEADYQFSYTESPLQIDFDLTKLDAVLQLSDQCPNIHPYWLKELGHLPIYTPQTTVAIDTLVPTNTVALQNTFTLGDLSVTMIGCPPGDGFWDNSGVGCIIHSEKHKVLFQGSAMLNDQELKKIDFLDAIFISWSAYSTLSPASIYTNLYDIQEYYSPEDDTNNLLRLCDMLPPSKMIFLAGADISSPDGQLFRYSSQHYADFLAHYMIACQTHALGYGQIIEVATGKLSTAPTVALTRKPQPGEYPLPSNHQKLFQAFLKAYGDIILLTDFGQEMFSTTSVTSHSLGTARFVFKVKHKWPSEHQVFEYDIGSNAFLAIEDASSQQLTQRYPYGLIVDYVALIQVLRGEIQFWELAHSKRLRQWYLQSPKTAPVTSLFLYFQEACNQALVIHNFKKRCRPIYSQEYTLAIC